MTRGDRRPKRPAPRRSKRFHEAPGGGEARTYLEGGFIALVLSVFHRGRDRDRIREKAAAIRAEARPDDDDQPQRWSRRDRQARDTRLAKRYALYLLGLFLVAGVLFFGRMLMMR